MSPAFKAIDSSLSGEKWHTVLFTEMAGGKATPFAIFLLLNMPAHWPSMTVDANWQIVYTSAPFTHCAITPWRVCGTMLRDHKS